ncbi:hypothetical protein B0H10DRAFT_2441980, partial [Mycena sp. CBHHK59/15]
MAPGELEQLLNRLPHSVLFRFQDESFPRSFRMKNPQLFSGNDWIDLDDLKAWLGQQEDLKNFLNEPTILDSWQLPNDPLGFVQSQSNYHDLFDNRSDIYGTAGPSQSGSATPFSDYSYTPDDAFFLTDHSSGLSSASSEFDYSSSSTGFSTPACDWFDADASLPDAEQSWDASQFIEDTLEQQALYSMASPIHPSFLPGSTPPSEASASISESLALHMTDPPCDGFGALLERDPSRLSPSMLSLMSQEELNEAGDEWEWNPSETIWLDAGVSSDVYVPEDPFPVTSNCKVVRIERVHGVPSQFPVPRIATAYILDFRAVRDSYQDKGGTVMPLDAILRDQDCQSWDRTPGERQKGRAPLVHQQLFASLKVSEQVRCRLFTFGRIYMDAKDTDAFEFAWDRIHEAFFAATGKQLAFKAWDPEGWLVTISGDMESAPWIGMARSFIKRMDTANRPTVNEFLMKVLRVCRRHAIEGLKKAVKPHVDEDQWKRFEGFVSLKTPQDVQEFSDWVFSLNIATISAWWNHKLNHKWILPGLLECLSGLSHEDWLTTPFTSNGNETQHHWTNSQTGIGLNARE